jgi:energy-coupling factor transport system permease protein
VSPAPAAILLGALALAALLSDRLAVVGSIALVLLVAVLRVPRRRRRPYVVAIGVSAAGVVVLSPLLWSSGAGTLLWQGPIVPVLGSLDVSSDELVLALLNGMRLAAVGLAFAVYALALDHDRLVAGMRVGRRSALAVALATKLVPTLERDAVGMREAVRGRGVELDGVRAHATLVSPLVAGSLERAASLAEAMEARGYGRPGATRAPRPPWTVLDRGALVLALAVVAVALWL